MLGNHCAQSLSIACCQNVHIYWTPLPLTSVFYLITGRICWLWFPLGLSQFQTKLILLYWESLLHKATWLSLWFTFLQVQPITITVSSQLSNRQQPQIKLSQWHEPITCSTQIAKPITSANSQLDFHRSTMWREDNHQHQCHWSLMCIMRGYHSKVTWTDHF